MRRHPSWDAPPPVPPRESAGQDHQHQHEIQWANPPGQMAGRLRSSSDYGAPATGSELFGQSDPRERVSGSGRWAAPPPRPPCLNRSISHSPTGSPYAGSVDSDISSQSSGAHPTIPRVATSRTTAGGSTISTTGRDTPQAAAPGGKVKKKRIRIKTERRREQCRRNQARYRNKQKFSTLELESTVERLRREVEQLQQQHAQSLHREPTRARDDPEVVVREAFRMFRFGLNVGQDQSVLPPLDQQIAFVTSAFDPDLRLGDLCGRTHLLEQLRRFSTLFDDYETILDPMVQSHADAHSSDAIIQSTFRLDVTVSTTTLRFVFPHLVRAEYHEIRWKLLGQRLRCAASAIYVFDPHGYITAVSWTIDWIGALQTVLTIEETAIALQQAQIGKDALLTVAGEEEGAAARATSVRSPSRLDRWSRWGGHHQHDGSEEVKEQKEDGVEVHNGERADYYFML